MNIEAFPYRPRSSTDVTSFMLALHLALRNHLEAETLLVELTSRAAMRGMDGCRSRGGA